MILVAGVVSWFALVWWFTVVVLIFWLALLVGWCNEVLFKRLTCVGLLVCVCLGLGWWFVACWRGCFSLVLAFCGFVLFGDLVCCAPFRVRGVACCLFVFTCVVLHRWRYFVLLTLLWVSY